MLNMAKCSGCFFFFKSYIIIDWVLRVLQEEEEEEEEDLVVCVLEMHVSILIHYSPFRNCEIAHS